MSFMDENFLLKTKSAQKLFHDYAKKMPIFDYHCHINVKEVYEDKSYDNLTEVWLAGDHYKWRAMRLFGIDEHYITGSAEPFEKFMAYAKTVSVAIGNPIYHWTHLELQRFFNIYEPLNEKTARSIWDKAERILKGGLTARKMIKMSNVVALCSTDDPVDDLRYHKMLKDEKYEVNVMPTFRPDKGVEINAKTFLPWIASLEAVCNKKIDTYDKLIECIFSRLDYFETVGCKLSDHGIAYVPYVEAEKEEIEKIFQKALIGETVSLLEEEKYKTNILKVLANEYAKRHWTMQIHIAATRNNNTKMFSKLGADSGFDAIDDKVIAVPLSRFLDSVNNCGMPKTILYTLNPKDNYVLGTMLGNFASSDVASKVQFGSAWWFNDQRDGMVSQMTVLANLGLLAKFVGMLTDSRSFTSYPRHEYFRRILCDIVGDWVNNGEVVEDYEILGKIIEDICYNNIVEYFGK